MENDSGTVNRRWRNVNGGGRRFESLAIRKWYDTELQMTRNRRSNAKSRRRATQDPTAATRGSPLGDQVAALRSWTRRRALYALSLTRRRLRRWPSAHSWEQVLRLPPEALRRSG